MKNRAVSMFMVFILTMGFAYMLVDNSFALDDTVLNANNTKVSSEKTKSEYKFKYDTVTEEEITNNIYIGTTLSSNSDVSRYYGDSEYDAHHIKYTLDYVIPGRIKNNVQIEMTGILGIPNEDQLVSDDLVVLLHGRCGSPPNSEYGFSYLVDYLASNGYMAVSINISELYLMFNVESEIIPESVNTLIKQLNTVGCRDIKSGKRIKLDMAIKGVYMLGHSRAGFHVFNTAELLEKNKVNVKHIISIAPCIVDGYPLFDTDADIDTTFIIPEFDGDVSELSGSDMYNALSDKEQRKATDSLYYLFGTNHNYFNTVMISDDGAIFDEVRKDTKLSRKDQMQFLMGIITDVVLGNHDEFLDLVEPYNYVYRIHSDNYVDTDLQDFYTSDGSELTNIYIDRSYPDTEETAFREPGYNEYQYKILSFKDSGSIITLDIEDFEYSQITLDLAIDSTTFREPGLANLDICYTITILDDNGDVVETYVYEPTIIYGVVFEYHDNSRRFSRWTPIEQINIQIPYSTMTDKILIQCNYTSDLIIKNIYTVNK